MKIGQVKATLGKAIRYVTDPEKTDGGRLVSGNFTASPSDYLAAEKSMLDSLEACGKGLRGGGVLAHHVIQSFDPEDPITPEEAHRIGLEFVERIAGSDHKIIVATHVDRHHIHNHIIICAANDATHRKLRVQKNTLKQWRAISDELCRENDLNVLREPDETRIGRSFREIYATAKGMSTKNRIRSLIDVTAARTTSFDELKEALGMNGVDVTVRGRHLTFTDRETGMRIRDTRLGGAYDQLNIMARLARETLTEISFNGRMIATQTRTAITVYLPGTKQRERLTIPRDRIIRSGRTWRAWLGADSEQVITDRRGRLTRRIPALRLYEHFAAPNTSLGDLAETKLKVTAGVSAAQRGYYRYQGRRLDALRDSARQLSAASTWAPDGDITAALKRLDQRIGTERADLQAVVISLADLLRDSLGDSEESKRIDQDISTRERRLSSLERDHAALEKVQKENAPQRERGPKRVRRRPL
ncbi:MAG: relaxase/mobilization nuclease domain-containing protein [Bifidobacteriaceae bacterium]|nr:relaxase/mobilization nuclease domain-containing protein [Bifidobacteriaceae bacterium]MCI1914413.1 relaxase/mobilization nuclease domain-containing protein [Bifidobacteriaceae bacterium]